MILSLGQYLKSYIFEQFLDQVKHQYILLGFSFSHQTLNK